MTLFKVVEFFSIGSQEITSFSFCVGVTYWMVPNKIIQSMLFCKGGTSLLPFAGVTCWTMIGKITWSSSRVVLEQETTLGMRT